MCKENLSYPAVPGGNENAEAPGIPSTVLKRFGAAKSWMTNSLCYLIDETETERRREICGQ